MDRKKILRSFELVFWGLIFYTFALDLFDIGGISSSEIISLIGVALMLAATIRLQKVNPKLKKTIFFLAITGLFIVATAVLNVVSPAVNTADLSLETTPVPLDPSIYTTTYISIITVALYSTFEIISVFTLLTGICDLTVGFGGNASENLSKKKKKVRNVGILRAIMLILVIASAIPVLRAYDTWALNPDTTNPGVMLAPSSWILMASLAYLVIAVIYIVVMIKTLVILWKISNAENDIPTVSTDSPIDVQEIKASMDKDKDSWDDEIK